MKMWFRNARYGAGWYVRLPDKKQVRLVKTNDPTDKKKKKLARMRWREMRLKYSPRRVHGLVETYLSYMEKKGKTQAALNKLRQWLRKFDKEFHRDKVMDLRAIDIETWAARWPNPNTQRTALSTVLGLLSWAERKGIIKRNPVPWGSVDRPRSKYRRISVVPTEAEHNKLLSFATPDEQDFIICAYLTGARPGELSKATAQHYLPDIHSLLWADEETKTAKRIVALDSDAELLVQKRKLKYPEGPLFRDRDGDPFTPDTVRKMFARLRREAGLAGKKLTAYSYRHWYAHRWIKAGRSPMLLARQMGTSLKLIQECYSHLLEDHQIVVDEVRREAQ